MDSEAEHARNARVRPAAPGERGGGHGDGRTARARATRARIIRAAADLFTESGYSTTSIGAVAAAAGVGVQTVYYTFGTKRAVLTAVLDQAVAGDDEPVPTLERTWARTALTTPDPAAQIRMMVEGAGRIHLRTARLLDVVRSAAATDKDLGEVWAANIEQRLAVHRSFMRALSTTTTLPDGMTVDTAADVCLALLSPETYHLLVRVRGWPHEDWTAWTVRCLVRELL